MGARIILPVSAVVAIVLLLARAMHLNHRFDQKKTTFIKNCSIYIKFISIGNYITVVNRGCQFYK